MICDLVQYGTNCLKLVSNAETNVAKDASQYVCRGDIPPGEAGLYLMEKVNLFENGGYTWNIQEFTEYAGEDINLMETLCSLVQDTEDLNKVHYQSIFRSCAVNNKEGTLSSASIQHAGFSFTIALLFIITTLK